MDKIKCILNRIISFLFNCSQHVPFLFLKSSVKLGINNLYCVLCGVTNMNDMDNSFLITTEIQKNGFENSK